MAQTGRGLFKRARQPVQEIIGRVGSVLVGLIRRPVLRTVDHTQADYAFWDRLYRGQEGTYKLGGLFARPIVEHHASWTLGKGFTATTGDAATDEALDEFTNKNLQTLISWFMDARRLGDGYLVVNPDGTLTEAPPNQVDIFSDETDFRNIVRAVITSQLEKVTITDEFRLDGRTVTVKRPNMPDEIIQFPNLTGRLAVIHLPTDRSANELYGRPMFEPLLPLFAHYDDVASNSIVGVKTMSNPVPVLEDIENPAAEMQALATDTETILSSDGDSHTRNVVDMSDLNMFATSGKFNWKAPASFTGDAWRMLKNLFYLMLQHINIPEWVWGGHIESSNASVDAQLPAWTGHIELGRLMLEPILQNLLQTWLATISLFMPVKTDADITIEWPDLVAEDRKQTLEEVKFARMDGMIDKVTGLARLNLVEDPEQAVKDAEEEAEAAQDDFDARVEQEMQRMGQGEEETMPGEKMPRQDMPGKAA